MRLILWLGLALGVLWGSYWFVGATAIEGGAGQWFAATAAQGMTTGNEGISVSGFPSRFDLTVTKPRLADPRTGWGWTAPFAQILSMTWKPWHIIAILPQTQQINGPGQQIALTSTRIVASLRLLPTSDLTLGELVIEGHDLSVRSDRGWQVGVGSAVLAVANDPTVPFGQRLGLEVSDLRPDPSLGGRMIALGDVISSVHLDAVITLSAALDRHAGATSPAVTGLIVNDFQLAWGSLRLSAMGRVAPGPDGVAQGQIDIRVEDWRQIPALAVALGLVRAEMGESLTKALTVLAESGADPNVLDLPLTFADGWMNLGPFPLGPAPIFDQRQ